jgi:amino acid adenylation domain-containing protein
MDVTLDAVLIRKISRIAQESGATLHMALLAVFGVVLGRWSRQDTFAIGTPVAGRSRVEIEPLIGFFVNTLALRMRLEGRHLTYRELVRRVRDTALSAYAHQDVPFERVVEEIQPERDTSRNPIFQVMFALLNVPLRDLTLPELDVSDFEVAPQTVQVDLEMSLFEAGDGSVSGRIHYARDLFDRPSMERFVAEFHRLVLEVAADPQADVGIAKAPDGFDAAVDAPAPDGSLSGKATWAIVTQAKSLDPPRKAGRKPVASRSLRKAETYAPPRSLDEEMACALFAEALGVARVGVTDSFFDLGGHSLLATRLLARVRSSLGIDTSLRAFFEVPTPEGLARRMAAARRGGGTAQPELGRASDADRADLSYAQRRMWFLERLQPGTSTFNVASALRLDGDLDAAALGRVFAALEARHESLRTRFIADVDHPRQIVDLPRPDPMAIVDLSGIPDPETERRLASEAATPFDLERGPLWRATLWRRSPREHVLSLVIHHIATDGWSMDLLIREMAALYEAFLEGRESPLAPLAIQYADWAAWQRAWLEAGESERQLSWWRQDLDGARPVELPADRPRPARRGLRGASVGFEIPPAAAEALARFAREEGMTLFHVLLACFQALLARHAATNDVVVGIPVANRTREESGPLVGLFVNTLAIRTRVDPDARLREIVRRVREKTLEAHARQDVPFEVVVEALAVERDLARNPLFDAMFVLQHGSGVERPVTGLRIETLVADTGAAEFDITLMIAESSGRLTGSLTYDTDLFEPASAGRLAGHYVALAEALGRDPDVTLGELDLSTPDERERIARSNRTDVPRPERTVTDLFEAQVARDGGALAVMGEEGSLTYAELDARAGAVARSLREAGVGPETGVGLLAGRTVESIVGMLGILKSGGVLVTLDASLPVERLARMLAAANVRAVVSERGLEHAAARAFQGRLPVIPLDAVGSHLEGEAPRRRPVHPSSAAYVLFTSGSTGEPKGTVVEHRAIADRLLCRAAQSGLCPGERALHFYSLMFDPALEEVLAPLVSGAAVVVHPDPRGETPAGWVERVARSGVTVAHLPVGFANELADDLARSGQRLPSPLRLIVVGGESPSGSRIADLLRAGREGLVVTNAYGPTEAVIEATAQDVAGRDACLDPVPIGMPLENTTVHLLDARMRPAPFGAFSEVFIGGVGLARGYAGRPAETAAVFLPDPFSRRPGARLYRTGDIARYRADGALVFAGRRDGQVKIRGFRVELGEIEAALLSAPGVREAAVLVSGESAHARLTGFIVPSDGTNFDPEAARESLRATLPEYMIPARIVPLGAMPLTISDKVDRRALLAHGDVERRGGPTAPRDELERRLAGIWHETLRTGVEDVHENFFDAGGNSLLALRLAAAVRRLLGRDLAVAEVFRRPTIAELAGALRAEPGEEGRPEGDGAFAALAPADIVRLRAGGGLAPLVCIHEIGGGVGAFASLASHLHPRRPVLGIQALDGTSRESLEEAAAGHADAIARAVPEGTVHLLGWSYGAWLAFEIATRLRERGREIGALILLDAAAPEAEPPAAPEAPGKTGKRDDVERRAISKRDGAGKRGSGSMGEGAALARAAAMLWGIEVDDSDPQRAIDAVRAAGVLPEALPDAEARAWLRGVAMRLEAAMGYRPCTYEGDAVVVRGTESIVARGQDEALGWAGLVTGRVTVAWAPGTHHSIVSGEGARSVAAIVERHAAHGAACKGISEKYAGSMESSAPRERAEDREGTR